MVKRAGKDVIPVEIYKENYELLKNEALIKRYNLKQYINEILAMNIEKDRFLQKYAPHLSVYSCENNRLTLTDKKIRGLVDIYIKDCSLYCEKDNCTDCMHTRFAWAIPEIAKLKPMTVEPKKKLEVMAIVA